MTTHQPTPADIRAQAHNSESEICPKCHGMSASRGTSCSRCGGIGEIPAAHETVSEIARLTRELREMTQQRDAAWQAQADLIECRIALRNSEAGRETAVDLAESALELRDQLDMTTTLTNEDRIMVLESTLRRTEAERDAARQDADWLARLLTHALPALNESPLLLLGSGDSQNGMRLMADIHSALAAHAQATGKAVTE